MLRADAPTEAFRRVGLFIGAAMLGLLAGRWVSSVIDRSGTVFPVSPVVPQPWFDVFFAAVALVVAYRLHDLLLRAAWIVLALQQLLLSVRSLGESAMAPWLAAAASVVFALILVIAGARRRTSRELALAAAIFMASIGFSMGLAEGSKRLRLHSVVSLHLRRM